jgi:hypothetical protein
MRLPEGILNVKGRKAIGLIQLQGSDGNDLREYGSTDEGVQTTCLVLTSPGDVITVSFLLDRGVADFAETLHLCPRGTKSSRVPSRRPVIRKGLKMAKGEG